MKVNCYAILPANVRYDKDLSQGSKLLYAELTAGSGFDGVVDEDIRYLQEFLDCDKRTLYRYFRQLLSAGYIQREGKGKYRLPLGFTSLSQKPVADAVDEDTMEFFKDFFKLFEKGLNCYIEKQELYHVTLKQRLEKFSRNELMRALENRIAFVSSSEWHQQPENRHNATDISLLIKSDQEVLKWLNMKVDKHEVKLTPLKFQ